MNSIKCGGGYIYKAALSDIEYIGYCYGQNGNESIQSAYSRVKEEKRKAPDLFFNAELFDFSTRDAASDVVCGDKIHRLTEGYGIAFPNNKTAVYCYKNNVHADDYVGAYPVLIQGGVTRTIVPDGLGGRRGRTAIGVDGDNLYVALVPDGDNDLTLAELRIAFKEVGARDAINLDGGGSTQYYSPCGNHFTGRNVRGFIGVWLKSSAPAKKEETTKKEGKGMRFAIIAGHGDGDPGTCKLGYKEADLTRELARLVKDELEAYGEVDILDTSKNWYKRLCKQGHSFDFTPYDYALELHLNSAANDLLGNNKITGTEMYVTRSEKVVSVEENILEGICSLGFKNRGVKKANFDLIYYIKKQGVSSALLEVCFLDDKDDVDLYMTNKTKVAKAIAEGIAKGYKLGESSLSADCNALAKAGIINSPDYWAKGKGYSDANVVALIQKFAAYLKKGG